MSYTKLHTPALVLSAHNVGETSRTFALFTPLVGTIYAKAQGVRELKSRHRFALQTFSCADVSLVSGKGGWRITNATPTYSLYSEFARDPHKKRIAIRIVQLLRRLITGEQTDEQLFMLVTESFDFLKRQELTSQEIRALEVLIVLRILHLLGYVKEEEIFESFLQDLTTLSKELLNTFFPFRIKAIRAINVSLKASQL